MAKTQEELTQLKTEYETLNNKIMNLSDEELKQVTGGDAIINIKKSGSEDPRGVGLDEDPTLTY